MIVDPRRRPKVQGGALGTPAAPSAPSAPPAPGVSVGSSQAGASAYRSGGATATTQGAPSGGIGPGPGTTNITPSGPPASAGDKKPGAPDAGVNKPKTGAGANRPKKPGPGKKPSPPVAVEDPMYWNNIMALNAQYGMERANAFAEQTLADNAFKQESDRMETDRERARRNLAESLLGRGSAVYGGMHRRDNTEARIDHLANRGRLDDDFQANNTQRSQQRADIESRLAPMKGTDYIDELEAWREREDARAMDMAEQGEPVASKPKPQAQVKRLNKKIKVMRTRASKIDDDKKRKQLRKKIQRTRRKRDKIRAGIKS
jgi:hypothetical protein